MFVNHALLCDGKLLRREQRARPLFRRGTGIAHPFIILALSFWFTTLYWVFPVARNRFWRYFLKYPTPLSERTLL